MADQSIPISAVLPASPMPLFEQVHVQGVLIQVPELLLGTHFHFLNEMHRGKNTLAFLHRNNFFHCFSLPGIDMQEFMSLQKVLVLVPLNPYNNH